MLTNMRIAHRQTVPEFEGVLAAGVDEAGRGCLAGPVTAAAVVFAPRVDLRGFHDSKQLTPQQREQCASRIRETAVAWAVVHRSALDIDQNNILAATMAAMRDALKRLSVSPELALIDGNRAPQCATPVWTIVRGDARVPLIGAASILAKTARDALMNVWHRRFPNYGFATHKGYGTALHKRMLEKYGTCNIHRLTFKPCQNHPLRQRERDDERVVHTS